MSHKKSHKKWVINYDLKKKLENQIAQMKKHLSQVQFDRTNYFESFFSKSWLLSKFIPRNQKITRNFSAFPDITPQNSNSKESYHGLFPLEQLLEQKSQTLNAQTSTFRATKVEDGISYCLKRVHGKNTITSVIFGFYKND